MSVNLSRASACARLCGLEAACACAVVSITEAVIGTPFTFNVRMLLL
jgi:hypothetical protein